MKINQISAEQTLPVRHQVLWPNESVDFCRVPGDDDGLHYGVYEDDRLVCVASVFVSGEQARLRKFATLPQCQGRGIGSAVIEFVLADLKAKGVRFFWCDARESAGGFYRRLGMESEGERFYKGDVPYFKMAMALTQ
ncbi:GNAT family N-acetyltransferase (plasmid) [Photobacterium sp. DA100]|uniref:GNAT family N-acetyltransferase n=1 Tax=Photobacterium sp. DA100 TaxID=3027472 RepID=UPI00247B0E3A|nr:GNAT family N-acetyltransferase [Photobacterium sp. DA100]WEM44585.1 GNAT family N-acetyltransferase [Photobacterium sp. DA100]